MSEKLNHELMWVEVALLMIPTSSLLALVFTIALPSLRYPRERAAIIALAAAVLAVVCLWRLIVRFLQGGVVSLRASSWAWWSGALLGALIGSAAFVSHLAPRSEPYTPWAEFRENFNRLALGLPLLLPLVHLGCEALFRRSPAPAPAPPSSLNHPAQPLDPNGSAPKTK